MLDRWEQRGLLLRDRERAARYLRHIGYYRLSAYVRSFEDSERDRLRADASFDDVLALYIFDRKLRLVILDALERVEVSVRTAVSDRMSLLDGPHWYQNPAHFSRPHVQRYLLQEVDRMVENQLGRRAEQATGHDSFVSALEHYVTRYGKPARPPSWVVFEELSFGTLRAVYGALSDTINQAHIAASLGLQSPVLTSWLLTYQRVRNISAHHGRLWNRGLGVYPAIPKSRTIRWLHDRDLFVRDAWRRQRLFPVVVSLQTILYTIAPGSTWGLRLNDPFLDHPDVPLAGMGIPREWFDDPFWPRGPA